MAITVSEIRRRIVSGTTRRGERAFRVTSDTQISPQQAQTAAGIPATNDLYPGSPTLRAKEHEVEFITEAKSGFAWDVTVRYEPSTGWQNPGGIDDPADPGFLEINVDIEARPYDAWRVGTGADGLGQNPNGAQATGTITDIGGGKLDSGGEPLSIVRIFGIARFSKTVSGLPDYFTIRDFAGSRNVADYIGAPTGSLLYQGGVSRRVAANAYQVDHTFHYDDWYHLVQVPERDINGIVTLNTDGQAATVFWKQPFRKYSNFDNLNINP